MRATTRAGFAGATAGLIARPAAARAAQLELRIVHERMARIDVEGRLNKAERQVRRQGMAAHTHRRLAAAAAHGRSTSGSWRWP
jgi:hypothetical protein